MATCTQERHGYYYQFQCHLFVCGDFVVWTQKPYQCERIAKTDVYGEEVLPVLLVKCYTCPHLVG